MSTPHPASPPARAEAAARSMSGAAQAVVAPTAMVIQTGHAQVEVDSVEAAVTQVQLLATRLGAQVTNTALNGGPGKGRFAEIQLRIPATRFSDALEGLTPLGDVESVNVSTQDVGEEYVDIEARLGNARRLEERLLQLLATRTGKLEEVLAVERELARIREEIERTEGRLRWLRSQVAMSTLSLSLHEPVPLTGGISGGSVVLDAVRSAWRNFVLVITTFIASLGVLVPLSIVLWLGWLGYVRTNRARVRAR